MGLIEGPFMNFVVYCPTKALLGQSDKEIGNWWLWDFNFNLTCFASQKLTTKLLPRVTEDFRIFLSFSTAIDCQKNFNQL